MSSVAIRRLLFVTALFCLPLPYALVEHGWVPAAWLVAVTALVITAAAAQGGAMAALLAKYLSLQAVALVSLCYVVALLLTWAALRYLPPARRGVVVGIAASGALLAALFDPIFHTTAVAGGEAVSLVRLFVE